MKPLFIPLKTEYYRAFERGDKDTEYRLYGGPWTERQCAVGRRVNIRRGYSTKDNLYGVVREFAAIPLGDVSDGPAWAALCELYPKATPETLIACIGIALKRGEIREATGA